MRLRLQQRTKHQFQYPSPALTPVQLQASTQAKVQAQTPAPKKVPTLIAKASKLLSLSRKKLPT